jgi:hypothetical protein
MVLGSIASILTHSEANISLTESTGISKTLTGNTDNGIRLAESSNENVLEFRSGPIHEANSLLDLFLEPGLGLVVLKNPSKAAAFLMVLLFFHVLLEELKEMVALHDIIFILSIFLHAEGDSSANDSKFVVTGHNTDVGS